MKRLLLCAATLAAALPATAQYKVVGPDGRITYTDRPPVDQPVNITPVARGAAAAAPSGPALPAELRPIVQRFPVVFYSAPDCGPCDSARQLLRQRGIPHSERQVLTTDDLPALERVTGSRSLPALTVGGQSSAGYAEGAWQQLLDLAGYPRESKLPRNYAQGPATPLVARAAPTPAPAPAPQPAPAPAPEPDTNPSPVPGIRF